MSSPLANATTTHNNKKILLVLAHPCSKSFTHTMASRYKTIAESLGYEVKVLDLYRDQGSKEAIATAATAASAASTNGDKQETTIRGGGVFDAFIAYDNLEASYNNPLGIYYREHYLSWANEYVFFFPVWWFDAPAILKNFIDVSFIEDFAFKIVNRRGIGLLTNKTAKLFVTSDAPAFAYKLGFLPLISTWKGRLSYCGIKVKRFAILGEKRWQDEKTCEKWLKSNLDCSVAKY